MKTSANDPLQFIFGRRSIRSFVPGEVDEATVMKLLEAAMAAPSARAHDPWRFVVVQNREMLNAMAGVLPYGRMLANAAAGILVCGDPEAAFDRQFSYMLQDCSAAIQNVLVGAHMLGLGTCWIGLHPREDRMTAMRELLAVPEELIPLAVIAIGHPGEKKQARTRYKPESVHWEKW